SYNCSLPIIFFKNSLLICHLCQCWIRFLLPLNSSCLYIIKFSLYFYSKENILQIILRENHILKLIRSCRSEEHTSELQSRFDLVCRLLLEKKKKNKNS